MFGCELGTPDAGEINGREPLGMTAKNGAPGGSFFVGGGMVAERVQNALWRAFWCFLVCAVRVAGCIILLTSAIWWLWRCCWWVWRVQAGGMVAAHGRPGRAKMRR